MTLQHLLDCDFVPFSIVPGIGQYEPQKVFQLLGQGTSNGSSHALTFVLVFGNLRNTREFVERLRVFRN